MQTLLLKENINFSSSIPVQIVCDISFYYSIHITFFQHLRFLYTTVLHKSSEKIIYNNIRKTFTHTIYWLWAKYSSAIQFGEKFIDLVTLPDIIERNISFCLYSLFPYKQPLITQFTNVSTLYNVPYSCLMYFRFIKMCVNSIMCDKWSMNLFLM